MCNAHATNILPDAHNELRERLQHVPQEPGVYLWKDANGTILYVGKSKNLRDRMRSYVGSPHTLSNKNRRLVSHIAAFDIIVTNTELEALLLEMTLIKKHRPCYNILLKDDKSYPYIKVTLQDTLPRVVSTRTLRDDGARYFGPYASSASVRTTLNLLNRLFAFRPAHECNDHTFTRHQRSGKPCLYYDMQRCLAPCVPALVTPEEYRHTIDAVCRFLEGKSDQVLRELRQRMQQAAESLAFERAAILRDQINALETVLEKQHVVHSVQTDHDVIAFAREEERAIVQVLFIRGGKLIGMEPYTLQGTDDESDGSLLASFITQFYEKSPNVVPNVLLSDNVDEPLMIAQWLRDKCGHRVKLHVPRRGEKRRLVELAARNALQTLHSMREQWLNRQQRTTAALSELRDVLALDVLPQRIECYDISNTHGTHSVASMVVFFDGKPLPAAYRRFQIQTVQGANDVASVHEVLLRRFTNAIPNQTTDATNTHQDTPNTTQNMWAILPDVVLIDGGKGQVHAAVDAMQQVNMAHIPVAGIVKGIKRDRFDILLSSWDEPRPLNRASHVFHFIQQIDEEAHRFAITYHRKVRQKALFTSPLDDIPGIGAARKKALLTAFGSLDAICAATVAELAAVSGITPTLATTIKQHLTEHKQ